MRRHGCLYLPFAAVLVVLLLAMSCGKGHLSSAAACLPQRVVACLRAHGGSALPYSGAPRTALEKVNSMHALPSPGEGVRQFSVRSEAHGDGAERIFHFNCIFSSAPELASVCSAETVVCAAVPHFTPFFDVKITRKLE